VYQCVYAEISRFSWDVHLCGFHATWNGTWTPCMEPFTGSSAHDYLHQHSKDGTMLQEHREGSHVTHTCKF
jgi:hypothetical protein